MKDADDITSGNDYAISLETDDQRGTRARVLRAAGELLESAGREALTTRGIALAAGVQPPALYRLFGDKDGLLDALGAFGFDEYLGAKRRVAVPADPVMALRDGWDAHVGFGLDHPAFYRLVYGEPRTIARNTARRLADELLRQLIERVAEAGRLRTSVRRAVEVVNSGGVGTVMTLLSVPPDERDPELSPSMREMTLRSLVVDGTPGAPATAAAIPAATLAAVLRRGDAIAAIGGAEHALLVQWLERIAES